MTKRGIQVPKAHIHSANVENKPFSAEVIDKIDKENTFLLYFVINNGSKIFFRKISHLDILPLRTK